MAPWNKKGKKPVSSRVTESDSVQINTDGGAYIGGHLSVSGDFAGRDMTKRVSQQVVSNNVSGSNIQHKLEVIELNGIVIVKFGEFTLIRQKDGSIFVTGDETYSCPNDGDNSIDTQETINDESTVIFSDGLIVVLNASEITITKRGKVIAAFTSN